MRHLERYLELLKESKVRGYRFEMQNHTEGFDPKVPPRAMREER